MTATSISQLPPFSSLVQLVRDSGPEALGGYEPAIDTLLDAASAAEYVGWQRATLYRNQHRTRKDGRPDFPPPDARYGRAGVWRVRTIVLHRAAAPGQGAAGRSKPRVRHTPAQRRGAEAKQPASAAA